MQYIGFIAISSMLIISILNIRIGVRRLNALKSQGQNLAWYKQMSIEIGIMFFLLSMLELLLFVNRATNNGVSDAVAYIVFAIVGIPLIACFILIFKYRTLPQNQPQKSEEA